jgi:hypothetical protein
MLQNMYRKAAALWVELRVELLSAIEYYAEDKVNSAQIWRLYWASHQVVPFHFMQLKTYWSIRKFIVSLKVFFPQTCMRTASIAL